MVSDDSMPNAPLRNELEVVRVSSNTRWSAVLAGSVVTASSWIVLHLLGMGVGMTAIDPDADSLSALGIGMGIWSAVAPVLALFVGGIVVSRLAPTPNRANRMVQATLVWAVTSLVAITAMFMVTSSVLAGAASVGGSMASGAADVAAKAASAADSDTLKGLGVDADDLLAPVNQRLRAEGKPAVTASTLEAAARDALNTAVRTGTFDRAVVVDALARNTALTPRDANDVAAAVEARWQSLKDRANAFAERARRAGLQALDTTGKALLGLAIALLLGLGAAMGGSLLTGERDRRADRPVVSTRTTMPRSAM